MSLKKWLDEHNISESELQEMLNRPAKIFNLSDIRLRLRTEVEALENDTNGVETIRIGGKEAKIIWALSVKNDGDQAEGKLLYYPNRGSSTFFTYPQPTSLPAVDSCGSMTLADFYPIILQENSALELRDEAWSVGETSTFYVQFTRLKETGEYKP